MAFAGFFKMFCAKIDLAPQSHEGARKEALRAIPPAKWEGMGPQSHARCDPVSRQSSGSASEPADKSEDVGKALWNNHAMAGGDSEALSELLWDL